MGNCHYDVTEASGKASNMNATIVACRNERVKNDFGSVAFFRKLVCLKYQPISNEYLYLYKLLNEVYLIKIRPV